MQRTTSDAKNKFNLINEYFFCNFVHVFYNKSSTYSSYLFHDSVGPAERRGTKP